MSTDLFTASNFLARAKTSYPEWKSKVCSVGVFESHSAPGSGAFLLKFCSAVNTLDVSCLVVLVYRMPKALACTRNSA